MTVLVIDNYDSFTYNLVHYIGELGAKLAVRRNDKISVDEVMAMAPEAIVISPGPCTPREAGVCLDLIHAASPAIPMFGVCLGHQSIVEAFGGKVVRAGRLMHGKTSMVANDGRGLYEGLPARVEVGRYHSLIAQPESLPPELEVTSRTDEGEIMGVRHRELRVEGVQFHPESVLTPQGPKLMANFLRMRGGKWT